MPQVEATPPGRRRRVLAFGGLSDRQKASIAPKRQLGTLKPISSQPGRVLRSYILVFVIVTNGLFMTLLAVLSPRLVSDNEDSLTCHVVAAFMILQAAVVIMVSFKCVTFPCP